MTETSTIRDIRKAYAAEQKKNRALNRKLLEYEAREALDKKARLAYSMAREAKFPDAGVRFLVEIAREREDMGLQEAFQGLLEIYTANGSIGEAEA